jgi:hypothetical protein
MTWSREFDEPILLAGRDPLRTLRDAGEYIGSLRKADRRAWRPCLLCELPVQP